MKAIFKKISTATTLAITALLCGTLPVFATDTDPGNIQIDSPGIGISDFGNLISNGIKIAIMLAALLTFVFLIWGGIEWITSGGNKEKYEAARNRITAALVGLAIVAAAWAIMTIISTFFNVDILNDGLIIPNANEPVT
jgi:type IV secretion system pilin